MRNFQINYGSVLFLATLIAFLLCVAQGVIVDDMVAEKQEDCRGIECLTFIYASGITISVVSFVAYCGLHRVHRQRIAM